MCFTGDILKQSCVPARSASACAAQAPARRRRLVASAQQQLRASDSGEWYRSTDLWVVSPTRWPLRHSARVVISRPIPHRLRAAGWTHRGWGVGGALHSFKFNAIIHHSSFQFNHITHINHLRVTALLTKAQNRCVETPRRNGGQRGVDGPQAPGS